MKIHLRKNKNTSNVICGQINSVKLKLDNKKENYKHITCENCIKVILKKYKKTKNGSYVKIKNHKIVHGRDRDQIYCSTVIHKSKNNLKRVARQDSEMKYVTCKNCKSSRAYKERIALIKEKKEYSRILNNFYYDKIIAENGYKKNSIGLYLIKNVHYNNEYIADHLWLKCNENVIKMNNELSFSAGVMFYYASQKERLKSQKERVKKSLFVVEFNKESFK